MAGAFENFMLPDQPQTAGSAFEPVPWQQQLGNYRNLENAEGAWRSADGSPWKPPEQGAFTKAIGNALGSEPGQRLMTLANFLGPGPRGPLAFANKAPSRWLPAPGQPRGQDLIVTPRYADVPRAGLSYEGGDVFFNVPKIKNPEAWPRGEIPDVRSYDPGPRMFRYADEFAWPFGDDMYVRASVRKKDFDFLNNGQHRGSINHATGEPEAGLSVAHRVEPGDDYKFAYLVKGKRIGQGSDSEPLLDVATAKPASKLYRTSEMAEIVDAELAKWRKQYGVSDEDWRALSNARFPK